MTDRRAGIATDFLLGVHFAACRQSALAMQGDDPHHQTMGKLFVERAGRLVAMSDLPFTSEDIFQSLLGQHPALLEGDLLTPDREPRRFVLVAREMAVPDSRDGGGRWSLDHLFLDQDGIPTLVEVKRSSDTRIRREVVGQVMDYAANAVAYWPPSALRQRLDDTHAETGGADEQILTLLGEKNAGADRTADVVEEYWRIVDTNLTAGRVRLLFVADRIERELARIIEFLNGQMSPAEVLGVEIRNYEGDGIRALTPVVIGLTEAALERKSVSAPTSTSIADRWAVAGPELRQARQLLDAWSENRGVSAMDKGASRRYQPRWMQSYLYAFYPKDDQVYFMIDRVDPDQRQQLRETLTTILGRAVKAPSELGVYSREVLGHWDRLEADFLPAFVEASRNPESSGSTETATEPGGQDEG